MVLLGCHLSSAKGFTAMGNTARKLGANTFQFFTRNPRGGRAKELDPADAAGLAEMQKQGLIGPVIAHAPYTINPCSAEDRTREFALQTMADDLLRLEHLPGNFYNFHPGSHVGQGGGYGHPAHYRNAERGDVLRSADHSPAGDHGGKGQ